MIIQEYAIDLKIADRFRFRWRLSAIHAFSKAPFLFSFCPLDGNPKKFPAQNFNIFLEEVFVLLFYTW